MVILGIHNKVILLAFIELRGWLTNLVIAVYDKARGDHWLAYDVVLPDSI